MFGRIQPVKDGSAVYAAGPSDDDDDTAVGDVQLRRSCKEFLEALRACAAFNLEVSSPNGPEPITDGQGLEKIAYEKMERALQEITSVQPSCSIGFQAKFEALFALEDWFGKEDFRVVNFAFELAEEAYAFFVAHQTGGSKPFSRMNNGSSVERRQSRLSFPRLLRLAAEPKSTIPSGARRSQS